MDENPWLRTPTEPPYVLPEDKEAVEEFNRALDQGHKHFLHIHKLLPEPFIGNINAPVLLLSNNPGFNEGEKCRQEPRVLEWMRANLHQKRLEYPFYYLDRSYTGDWWIKKLRHLIQHLDGLGQDGRKIVAKSILNIVYFPYPSQRFGHKRLRVPSQEYSFRLVRDAVNRNAVIVLMRSGKQKLWMEAVPQLNGYRRFFLVKNPRTPVISPNNCSGYAGVESAIDIFATAGDWNRGEEHAPVS